MSLRVHSAASCPECRAPLDEAVCARCGSHYGQLDGVPVLMHGPPASTYTAAATLYELLGRFGRYYERPTFAEQAIRRSGAQRVLSVGEGSGEYVLALAAKLSDVDFAACDLEGARVAHAERLRRLLGVENVSFAVADAQRLPYRPRAFDLIFERGVFHLLPDRAAHIREIQRLGPWLWQVTDVANGAWYWRNWRVYARLARLRGVRASLADQEFTVAILRELGGPHDWKQQTELVRDHGMTVVPLWHDAFVFQSYHRRFPGAVGRWAASFGFEAEVLSPERGGAAGPPRDVDRLGAVGPGSATASGR